MKFEKQFADLRAGYLDGTVELEGEWGFTTDWEPTGWLSDDTWARIKLDAYVKQDKTSARVIDYKTGKRFGNEIAHSQQCLLYAIAAFARDPDLGTYVLSSGIWTKLKLLHKITPVKKQCSLCQASTNVV